MKKAFGIVWDGVRIFSGNNGFTSAAAISFYAFFSIIPMMLIITASLGFVLGSHPGLLERVIGMVRQSLPYLGGMIIGDLRGLALEWRTFGWLGLFSLLWSADFVLGAMAEALCAIFGTVKMFGYVRQKLINLMALLLAVAAALLSVSVTAASIILRKYELVVFGADISYYLIQSLTFKYILPFLLVAAPVAIVYRVMSGPNLNFRYAFYGSLVFTTLWEIAKHLFAWYVSNFQSYNKFYGSLGTIMVLLVWIFYSANILLFSAAVSKAAYDRNVKGGQA